MLKTINLYIAELESLKLEILGNQLRKGLINEMLDILTKYNLHKLVNNINLALKPIEDTKESRIIELGTLNENNLYEITPMLSSGLPNKNYELYISELAELYNQQVLLEYTPIKLSKLSNIITLDSYNILFQLIEDDTNE